MLVIQSIQNRIYEIRGERVMLDFDLAALYEVETRALNQAVKRNIERFPEDFMFQLKSFEYEGIKWKNSIFNQATIQNIGADKYNTLPIPVTNIKEQLLIVNHIETKTSKINNKITLAKQEIELLKEYRQALIFETVTGKIDVTNN